jgi:hypothetical protein
VTTHRLPAGCTHPRDLRHLHTGPPRTRQGPFPKPKEGCPPTCPKGGTPKSKKFPNRRTVPCVFYFWVRRNSAIPPRSGLGEGTRFRPMSRHAEKRKKFPNRRAAPCVFYFWVRRNSAIPPRSGLGEGTRFRPMSRHAEKRKKFPNRRAAPCVFYFWDQENSGCFGLGNASLREKSETSRARQGCPEHSEKGSVFRRGYLRENFHS